MIQFRWQRLNPVNSLFGRIFLWFWISAVIIIITTALASRHLGEQLRYSSADAADKKLLEQAGARLNTEFHQRSGDIPALSTLLRHEAISSQIDLLLVAPSEQGFVSSFPPPRRFELEPFLLLDKQQAMLQIESLHWQFTGPLPLRLNGQDYLLFAGTMQPPDFFIRLRETPYFFITLILCLSGGLCFGLAWSLLRPIGQLIQATRQMASGDLASRVGSVADRRDEVGELGREFNDMAMRLQAMVESQKRILADISHELRSPLARLQVAIGIAYQREQQAIPELKRIEKEANRIDTMLEQVLTLARMDAAQQMIELQAMPLETVLDPLCEDICFEAKEKGIQFTFDYPRGLVIEADHPLLHSALENVLRNALCYARSEVSLVCERTKDVLNLVVIDDGPGLAEKDLCAVFRPFYRASGARNRETGGTGLGLAIASAAMAAHKGDISAGNRTPTGLRVRLKLPLTTADHTLVP